MNEKPDNAVILTCELNDEDLTAFVLKCAAEGKSLSEKLEELVKNFLTKGDNHLRVA
jgi:hypothetical protein